MANAGLRRSPQKLAVLALLVSPMPAACAGNDDARELEVLLEAFLAGASANDVAAHERFWGDELVYTSSAGTRFGKAEIMDGLRQAAAEESDAPPTVYSAEDVDVRVYGDTAVVAFRLIGSSTGDVQHYFNTGMFAKRAGEWRAVAWQATKIPESRPDD